MAEQDFSEIARLAERFGKEPKSRIFVQLADAYRKNNMVDEALEVLKQGLQYHPQYPLAYLILGKCYYDKRMYVQSKEALEKTIEFDPFNVVALRMLAQICETLKDEKCQITAYKGIIQVDPSDEMARSKLAALEVRQKKEVYTLTLAQEYEHQGNFTEALKVYEQLSFMDPTDLTIKQKIKELRDKISGVTEQIKKEEEKVAELKMENYFQPEEINIEPTRIEIPTPEPDLGARVLDLKEESAPPVVEPEKIEPKEEKEVTEEPEEILSLDEFLVEPAVHTEEAGPSPVIEEPIEKPPEVIPVQDIKTAEVSPLEEEKVIEESLEVIPAVETSRFEEEKVIEKTTEIMPTEEMPVVGEGSSETEVSRSVESEKIEPAKSPIEKTEEVVPSEPVKKVIEEKMTEEKPISAEEEKKKEEPSKPKEEDFKSFQDWLSSLLK